MTRLRKCLLLLAFAACRMDASSLLFTLSPSTVSAQDDSFPVSAAFEGTLTDTDTGDTCDSSNVNCLYLNFITFSFDQDTASSHLSGDIDMFYANVPGLFSDDSTGLGLLYTYTGTIFGIKVAPNTPVGVYTGSVSILGGYDSQSANSVLATASWTLVDTPEPSPFGLAMAGTAAIIVFRRRALA